MSGSRVRELIVASVVMAAASAMGAQCAAFAVRGAKDKRNHVDSDDRAAAVAFVAGAVSLSLVATITTLILEFLPKTLLASQSSLAAITAIATVACLAVGVIGATVMGAIDGAPRVPRHAPRIKAWQGASKVTWRAHRTVIRPRRIRTIIDRLGDVLRRALIRLADALRIVAVAAVRTGLNLLFEAAKIALNWLIICANALIKVSVIAARMIAASVVSAILLFTSAAAVAITTLARVTIVAVTPVAAIGIAASMLVIATASTLRYLTVGSLTSLLILGVSAAIAEVGLSIAWIILASQRPVLSVRSARRSASIAGPYAVLFVAVGGWVVGLPGTFGPGRIHVGWITIALSALLALAFLWSQFTNRHEDEKLGDHVHRHP